MTPEVTAARRAVTGLALAAALFAAVVFQFTVVNRLPLPGAGAPDLVLVLVAAIAVTSGPLAGTAAGFAGGLALDVAPPAAHYTGPDALVFCLAGYGAARVVRALWETTGEQDPVVSLAVMAAAAAAGEAGRAGLGLLLSDPDVTGAAVSRILPGAVLYDLLLAPPAFWLAARLTRGAGAERAPVPEFSRGQRLASGFRQASAGAAPNLRLAGSGRSYRNPSAPRGLPRLNLAGTRSPAVARTTAAAPRGAAFPLAGGRTPRLSFSGDLAARTAARAPRTPGRNWLGRSRRAPSRMAPSRTALGRRQTPRRGWLSGGGGAVRRRRSYAAAPSRGWLRRSRHPGRSRRQRLLRLMGMGR